MAGHLDKTVIVLDHCAHFNIASGECFLFNFQRDRSFTLTPGILHEIDEVSGPSDQPSPPAPKSVWTVVADSAVEYARIVYDIFPEQNLVAFIASDSEAHQLNSWSTSTQTTPHIIAEVAALDVPSEQKEASKEYGINHGISAALELLTQPTEEQAGQMLRKETVFNTGRIICLTTMSSTSDLRSLDSIVKVELYTQKKKVERDDRLLPIDSVSFSIINLSPELAKNEDSIPTMFDEIHCLSTALLSGRMTELVMQHYGLASTTVTGIPMHYTHKTSAGIYEVEIMHPMKAHTVNGAQLPRTIKPGTKYETVILRVCNMDDFDPNYEPRCAGRFRFTPFAAHTTLSSILVCRLLRGGRLFLEMVGDEGCMVSHMLCAKHGVVYICALEIPNSSATEESVKAAHRREPLVAKHKQAKNWQVVAGPVATRTRYFPFTLGHSVIYHLTLNVKWLPHLLQALMKPKFHKVDEMLCKQFLLELYKMAMRADPLPFSSNIGTHLTFRERVISYIILCLELSKLIECFGSSKHHEGVASFLRNVRSACAALHLKANGKRDHDNINEIFIHQETTVQCQGKIQTNRSVPKIPKPRLAGGSQPRVKYNFVTSNLNVFKKIKSKEETPETSCMDRFLTYERDQFTERCKTPPPEEIGLPDSGFETYMSRTSMVVKGLNGNVLPQNANPTPTAVVVPIENVPAQPADGKEMCTNTVTIKQFLCTPMKNEIDKAIAAKCAAKAKERLAKAEKAKEDPDYWFKRRQQKK